MIILHKEKNINKLKAWHQNLKKTPRGQAYLKLIYWGIFFLILFIILAFSIAFNNNTSQENNTQEPITEPPTEIKEEPITLGEMENNLLNSTYTYKYNILINDITYLFEGTKYNTYEEGYKTSSNIIKYYIDNTGTYQVIEDTRIPITNLYEGLDPNLFNIEYLFNIINNLNLTRSSNTYSALDEYYEYKLNINDEQITSIIVTSIDKTISYDLNFANIEVN